MFTNSQLEKTSECVFCTHEVTFLNQQNQNYKRFLKCQCRAHKSCQQLYETNKYPITNNYDRRLFSGTEDITCWKCQLFITKRLLNNDVESITNGHFVNKKRKKISNYPCDNNSLSMQYKVNNIAQEIHPRPTECCICGQNSKQVRGLFSFRHLCISAHPDCLAVCDGCFAQHMFTLGRVDTSKACGCPEALLEVLEMNDVVSLSPIPTCPLCRAVNFGSGMIRRQSLSTTCRTKSPNLILSYFVRFQNLPSYALPFHFYSCLDLLHVYIVRGHPSCNTFLRSVLSLHGDLSVVLLAVKLFSWGQQNTKVDEIIQKCNSLNCSILSL